MQINGKHIGLLVLMAATILVLTNPLSGYASDTRAEFKSINKMTEEEYSYILSEISKDALYHTSDATNVYIEYFTQDCALKYGNFISENDLGGGDVIERSVEYIKPEYNTTGNTVIMVNLKATFWSSYNMCYLFKYTIDTNGKIADITVWQY